jgi:coenzyme F420-reducing hydrogenase delta subunit
MSRLILLGLVAALPLQAADAAETITYSYDAKGRLVKVVHSGTVNNGVTADYTIDKADNRKTLVVAGSPNPPPP